MRMLILVILVLLFSWLVLFKFVNRLLRRLGRVGPCPSRFSWLLDFRPSRWYRNTVLDWIGLQPGTTVVEIGPGPGTFTVPTAQRIRPGGRLVAIDIQPGMIAKLERRLQETHAENVATCLADASDLPLKANSVDHVFLISALPEIPDRGRALAEIHRVLRPTGVLSVSEDFLDPDYSFRSETIRLVKEAGYTLIQSFGGVWLYTLNFRKLETSSGRAHEATTDDETDSKLFRDD